MITRKLKRSRGFGCWSTLQWVKLDLCWCEGLMLHRARKLMKLDLCSSWWSRVPLTQNKNNIPVFVWKQCPITSGLENVAVIKVSFLGAWAGWNLSVRHIKNEENKTWCFTGLYSVAFTPSGSIKCPLWLVQNSAPCKMSHIEWEALALLVLLWCYILAYS